MATQLAERPQNKVQVAAGAKLAAFIPQTLEEAWRLAGALASSGMTPKSYGADQNKIMVGMMAGAEVGLTPMAALQSIAVIGNNPSLWGDGALGLIQASGLLEDMDETDDGQTATCIMHRKGRKTPILKTFSMEDAKKAGLAGKAGPWTQYPARMRQMRARAFAMRDGFADVLRGLHIAEEARDYAPMMDGGALNRAPVTAAALLEQARTDDPPADDEDPNVNDVSEHEGRGERPTLDQAKAEIDELTDAGEINARVVALTADLSDEDGEVLRAHALERLSALSA